MLSLASLFKVPCSWFTWFNKNSLISSSAVPYVLGILGKIRYVENITGWWVFRLGCRSSSWLIEIFLLCCKLRNLYRYNFSAWTWQYKLMLLLVYTVFIRDIHTGSTEAKQERRNAMMMCSAAHVMIICVACSYYYVLCYVALFYLVMCQTQVIF